jgi:hypothetical protein
MISLIAAIFVVLAIVIFPIACLIGYMIGTIIGLLIRFARWVVMASRQRAQAAGVRYEDEHA